MEKVTSAGQVVSNINTEANTAGRVIPQPSKFHKISLLIDLIHSSIKTSELVDTASLTVAEQQVATSMAPPTVSSLFEVTQLSEPEQKHLDRELVNMVQNLMASKIEAAVTELEAMGVTLEDRLYSEYTQAPEDRL